MRTFVKVLIVALLMLAALTLPRHIAHAAGVCPAVGQDTDCGIIITVSNTGATVVSTGQGPFDGIEDTLVGVVNNHKFPVFALGLSSAQSIFAFDGDGIDTFGVPGNARDNTGYGGPNAFFTDIDPSLTSGIVRFITPIPPNGGTGYFSLEEAVATATSCRDAIKNSVSPPAGAGTPAISATFTPNRGLTINQAATICGFQNFDWVQRVTRLPDPGPYFARNANGAFDPSVNGPVHLTSARTPFNDPPQGGGYADPQPIDNSFPFYYNPNNGEKQSHETAMTLSFLDIPADPCLPGGTGAFCNGQTAPAGSSIGFTTHLAGVRFNGKALDLGIGFTWKSTFNGTAGGVATTKNGHPVDPGSGTGGITITSLQEDTTYDYEGITVTSVNDGPVGPAPSMLVYTGSAALANGVPTTLSAQLTTLDSIPIPGENVVITVGSDSSAQSCTGTTDATGTASCNLTLTQPLGPGIVAATFAGDDSFLTSSTTSNPIVFAYTSGGAFVVGNKSAGTSPVGRNVTFWGAQWAQNNSLSGGPAPSSFKGFENSVTQPTCGTSWTTNPGNSSNPPSSVPAYTAVIVSSNITKSGSIISGDTLNIVIVKVGPGYAPDPGHAGTGTVVAVLC